MTAQELIEKWATPHHTGKFHTRVWFHKQEIVPGVWTPGHQMTQKKLESIDLPTDLQGKTVLDIGCNDGFFSFECERRGAKVRGIDHFADVAIDVKEFIKSKAQIETLNFWDVEGEYDIVLFMGMLYHRQDPLRALKKVFSLTKEFAIIETHTAIPNIPAPAMVFYPGRELNDDISNWWGPNELCVLSMLEVAGFEQVKTIARWNNRMSFHAYVERQE